MAKGNSAQRFSRLKKVLSLHAIAYYLCTRFGSSRMRSWAFDQKYSKDAWYRFDDTRSPAIVNSVEKYARKGRVLELGCGAGYLASHLNPDCFESYLGVDISSEAIGKAQKERSQKIKFEVGDMQDYKCKEKYDLIVFEESLYYVPFFRRRLLRRYARWLRPGGLFLVTIRDPARFRGMIRMIRNNFQIIEDRFTSPSGGRLLLVFR